GLFARLQRLRHPDGPVAAGAVRGGGPAAGLERTGGGAVPDGAGRGPGQGWPGGWAECGTAAGDKTAGRRWSREAGPRRPREAEQGWSREAGQRQGQEVRATPGRK